ncbi:MAG: hypothetical protein ACYC0T_21340 [Ramlibacter sp.]
MKTRLVVSRGVQLLGVALMIGGIGSCVVAKGDGAYASMGGASASVIAGFVVIVVARAFEWLTADK